MSGLFKPGTSLIWYKFVPLKLKQFSTSILKALVRSITLLILFWVLIFTINRIVFYFCTVQLLGDISIGLMAQSFYHAFRLDLSMLGYLTSAPVLLLLFYYLFQKAILLRVYDTLNVVFVVLYNLCAFGECGLYREWKAKLSVQALLHFANPEEVFKSASLGLTVLFFGLVIVFSTLYIWLYRTYIKSQKTDTSTIAVSRRALHTLAALPIIAVCWVLAIRGGVGGIPIQSSDSFFCNTPIVNDASVNPLWNLSFDFIYYQYHGKENPFKIMDDAEAAAIVASLYKTTADSTEYFLTTDRPNLVFIMLESWSANCVKRFGGDDYAPFLDSLSGDGIYFTSAYPAGYVSDQGIPAILSSFPATSRIAIINQTPKSVKLPCINQDLEKYGYSSGFIFGGDLNYGNIRSYLFNKQWKLVLEEKDFPTGLEHGALGIQDADMAGEFLKTLNAAKAPFIYSWFTLSSHMPYDFKYAKQELTKKENNYVNSIRYTDDVLKRFFAKARKQPWYANTLFVICADHSHDSHRDFTVQEPEYHKIPMLFYGNVIKKDYRGKNVSRVVSQLDIAPSLLHQMNLPDATKQYVWGKNMFNPTTQEFAYYCSFGTGGMVTPKGTISYQHKNPELLVNTVGSARSGDSLARISRAYQQMIYKDFMER